LVSDIVRELLRPMMVKAKSAAWNRSKRLVHGSGLVKP
jgi:hypothetical protein